jgi:hypothetical protein
MFTHLFRGLGAGVSPLLVLLAAAPCLSQTTATIVGRVTDPAGASVAAASVAVENVETSVSLQMTTGAGGEYAVPNLPPGTYRVSIGAAGFKTNVTAGLSLSVNQTVRVDVTLQVGDVETRVEVQATVPVVQSDTSSLGSVVDGTQIASMPLDGRGNMFSLLALAPGVQRTGSNPLISGGTWVGSTNMTVDGVSSNDIGNERLVAPVPSLDAVAEFKVIANGASAEFGHGGAQVVMITKSGSNEFHGSVFAFNRNRALSAKNFFATHLPKPEFNRNEFGGTLGGPVVRNNMFFFGSYEGLRLDQSATAVHAMPTTALKAGDFTGLPALRDPFNGGAPFPNNQIPQNRISPVATELMTYASDPNGPGTGAAGLGNNFTVNLPRREGIDRYSGRIDHQMTANDRVTARYYHVNNGPFVAPANGTDKFGNWGGFGIATRNFGASYLRVISPTMVNDVRFGYNREQNFRTPQNNAYDPSTVIPGLISPVEGLGGLPTVNIVGFAGFRDQPGSGDVKNSYELANHFTWRRDTHTLKMGVEFQRASAFNFQNPAPVRGAFTFDGRYSGHPFADFLLGAVASTSRVSKNVEAEPVNNRYATYLQDDWTVTSDLTLNLGVRYEYAGLIQNARGDMANFSPELNQVVVIDGIPDPRLASVLPIVMGTEVGITPDNYINKDLNNFAPRVGFAWRPLGSTRLVARGSYGIFHNVISNYSQFFMAVNPPFRVVETFEPAPGTVPSLTWVNPFPGNGTIPTSPGINAVSADRRNPYHQQWNMTLETEVLPNTSVRASYVGNRGTHLERNFNLNDPAPAPGNVQPRRPYQPWGAITYLESGRSSITHQLQLGAVRRFASGLAFQFEYQYTHALGEHTFGNAPMDNRNTRLDRGHLDFIRRHWATANYIYDLPFGKGRRWGSSVSGVVDQLVSGWRLAGLTAFGSGEPYSVTFTSTTVGWPSNRADIVGNAVPDDPTIARWFNPGAFAVPAPFTYGNSARNLLFGPGFFNWDAAVFKQFSISEGLRLDFRAEVFNILNHPNFGLPASNISVPATAGTITSASEARNVQFALKLLF